jgi:formiminotetrahydrofolate cyclodeaminase
MEPGQFSDLPLRELLERFAQRSPAPGGGSAAGATCALAAALVEMAAAYETEGGGDVVARARELRASALELAERDLSSYAPVLSALRLARDDPARPERLESALAVAAEIPLAIARCAAEVAELGAGVTARAGRHLRGDAVAGTLLAEAACRTAVRLVDANVGTVRNDYRAEHAGELAARAGIARDRVLTQDMEV